MPSRPRVPLILLFLSSVSATRILTRSMIRSPRESGGGEQHFTRVELLSPEREVVGTSAEVAAKAAWEVPKAVAASRDASNAASLTWEAPKTLTASRVAPKTATASWTAPKTARLVAPSGPHEKLEDLFREVPSQRLEVDEVHGPSFEEVPLRFAETTEPTTEQPTEEPPLSTTLSTEVQLEANVTQIQPNKSTSKTTLLYPVARLWEVRSETDIWSLLHAAYTCLFSGLNCFSDKVYPMFRSYLGLNTGTRPTRYPLLLPRTSQSQDPEEEEEEEKEGEEEAQEEEDEEEEEEEETEESRGLLKGRLMKEFLIGLLLAHATLLPWLGGVGIASGKALFTGLLSLGAAGAVAAVDSQKNNL